jgi:hypothetical protein
MKYIIFEQENKKLGLTIPADVDLSIEEIARMSIPPNTEFSIVDNLNIDDYFFDAYEYIKGEAIVNYEKAKEIQKNKWREKRKSILEKLDVEFMMSLEKGDIHTQKLISDKKQELRDITNIFMPNDLQTIKSTWPNILNVE